ncbi:hypothetical protein EGH22_06855 [Halomicroarcula sp. F28]|uniref:hypothetical protein n=1 Tax=Haloarcula salinisoli TaxID=2487746 RepID=UPI001C736DE4|nr:hypothetical protein [Halomicroarcula salinisoli]MBX0286040.1 hypothetical protein [Halomicroarcula salinisoli]
MSKFTLYRADIDSPRLARLVGKVPGIAVGDEEQADEGPADDVTAPPGTAAESEDDGGLRERVPVPDTDIGDTKSVVKTYGLLGLGVSMVMLGIATVGIWVYRRRKGGDGESETPPPATGLDRDGPTVTPSTGETELSTSGTSSTSDTESSTPSPSIVTPDESPEPEQEPAGRTEGDRSDVEWETRDTTPASERERGGEPDEQPEPETPDDEPRPTESVDVAPLLGAAFLAVSGAVVKWLQADADEA